MSEFVIPETTQRDQAAASDPATSAWVDANAGSGKTHVLARRVVRLLLRGEPPSRLICLTYTKAAAANMANRVLGELAKFATLPDDELDRALIATDGGAPDAERRLRARRLFAEALETPGGLKVQTIHAFCDRVLHQFPFEAGVPASFSVLEEQGAAELLADARARVLVEAAADRAAPLGRALETAVAAASDDGLAKALDEAVNNRHALSAWIEAAGGATAAGERVGRALGLKLGETEASVEAEMLTSPYCPRARWPQLARSFAAGKNTTEQENAAFLESAANARDDRDALASYLPVFLKQDEEPRSDKTFPGARIRDNHPELCDALRAERDRLAALIDRRRAARTKVRSVALITLAEAVIRRYEAAKARRALLDFDDLAHYTRVLLENGAAAWVHYKLDAGIDHVLLDEAQDTSADQWAILNALTAEFFAGKGASERNRTMFAVGDAKQSIFGFQGAAPAMFGEMQRRFQREAGEGRLAAVRLDVSFRSAQPVLDAVDRVFARQEAREGLDTDNVALIHRSVRAGAPGTVELWPLLEPEPATEDRDAWNQPLDAVPQTSTTVQLALRIAASVAAWVRDGKRRRADGRPITPGDVLILVRRRGALFEAVLKALRDANLPVAGADRLKLAEHIAVKDLVALGDALLCEHDDLALACVLKSPLFGFTDDDLIELAAERSGTLAAALAASPRVRDAEAAARLARWSREARELRPFDFYSRVLGRDGGRRAMLARLGPEAADPLDEFLALALGDERIATPALADFLARMRRSGAEIKRDMEIAGAAVRVMTVHGAKGLEAPVVILADTVARPEGSHDPRLLPLEAPGAPAGATRPYAWVPVKEGEPAASAAARQTVRTDAAREYRRLLYVALTRAADVLVVCGARGRQKLPDGCWYELVRDALAADATAEPADGWSGEVLRWSRWPEATPVEVARVAVPKTPHLAWLDRAVAGAVPAAASLAAPRRVPLRDKEAAARGLYVHKLFQRLPAIAAAEREGVAALLAKNSGLDAETCAALARATLAVLADPAVAPLFGPGSRAEVPIAGQVRTADGGERFVSRRLDRLHVGPDGVAVLDFKTDRRVPQSEADVPAEHLEQLAHYRALLAEALPSRKVACSLVYVGGPRLIAVSAATLDRAVPHLAVTPP